MLARTYSLVSQAETGKITCVHRSPLCPVATRRCILQCTFTHFVSIEVTWTNSDQLMPWPRYLEQTLLIMKAHTTACRGAAYSEQRCGSFLIAPARRVTA